MVTLKMFKVQSNWKPEIPRRNCSCQWKEVTVEMNDTVPAKLIDSKTGKSLWILSLFRVKVLTLLAAHEKRTKTRCT